MDGAFAGQHTMAAVDERTTQRSRVKPHGDLVRETREDAAFDRSGLRFAALDIQAFISGDSEKLLGQLRGFPGRAGIYPKTRATLRVEPAVFRIAKRAEQKEKVRLRVGAKDIFTIFPCLFTFDAAEKIPSLGEGGDQADGRHATILLRGQKHAGISRMDWEGEHTATQGRDLLG
jgi:hypothetical protein